MRILHNVSLNIDATSRIELANLGFDCEPGFATFKVFEDDPRWPAFERLIEKYQAVDIAETKFTKSELRNAQTLEIRSSWHFGYPQPDDDFGYRNETYEDSQFCPSCGIGLKQKAPFRMSKQPSWGAKSILQLNWVFDEYFVRERFYNEIFKPLGIGCRPVVYHKSGSTIDDIVQLNIECEVELDLGTEYAPVRCEKCGGMKYPYNPKGFQPVPKSNVDTAMFKSKQWFGSGALAHKLVFVNSEVHERFSSLKGKGATFAACRSL